MDTTTLLALVAGLLLGLAAGGLAGAAYGRLQARAQVAEAAASAPADDVAALDRAEVREQQAVLREGLERLGDQLRDLEHGRAAWEGQLKQQVDHVRLSTEQLRRETASLATALRKPQVRGRWGEMHLRRAVELAGLVDRCDFAEQVVLEDGSLRPDLVVRLAGGRSVVVDAKVPLDAFLDAVAADDDHEAHAHHLDRHARQLRTHVEQLAAKRYWRALEESPEFVVLFVPGESFLSAALDAQPDLLEHAAARKVVLATPTTLIALLRTVALGWTQAAVADQAREVHRLGRDLGERLGTMTDHLDAVGRSLGAAVTNYNKAVGSWEARVLVAARRFDDLGVVEVPATPPRQVEEAPRTVTDLRPARRAEGA